MQEAFLTIQDKFANTILLEHPDENLPYIINTDVSAKAIGTVLLQQDREGNMNTVIPRLTKILRSGITFVSRNVISRKFL